MKLLSHDMTNSNHQLLLTDDILYTNDSVSMSIQIEWCLNNLDIYEYCPNDTDIIPVINPSALALQDEFILNPISNDKKDMLFKLSQFLDTNERIDIEL